MRNTLWGSTAALIIGGLGIIAGISNVASRVPDSGDTAISGAVAVLGALAYRSLKRRRLGVKPDTGARKGMETAFLVAALLLIILQKGFLDRLNRNPFVNLIVPAWAIIAYAAVFFRRPRRSGGLNTEPTDGDPVKGVIYTEAELKEFRKRGHCI